MRKPGPGARSEGGGDGWTEGMGQKGKAESAKT